jgi:plasmid stability protein
MRAKLAVMAQIVIRNIDDAVVAALRRRAAASGTSMEEQARRALARAVGLDREAAVSRLTEVRRSVGRLEGPSVVDDLRRDRDRDSQ